MSLIDIQRYIRRPIQAAKFVRNGKYPESWVQSALADSVNHAARWRAKQVYAKSVGILDTVAQSAGTVSRWRFAWRSGPYARHLQAKAIMMNCNSLPNGNPYGLLTVRNGAGTSIGTMRFYFGANAGSTFDNTADWSIQYDVLNDGSYNNITLTADTEYFGEVSDVDQSRIRAIVVYEHSVDVDTSTHPNPSCAARSPVYDGDRQDVATVARKMWKQGASPLWHVGPSTTANSLTTTSTTLTSVLFDPTLGTGTAVSAATVGATLDMTYKGTSSRTGASAVPVTMWCYVNCSSDGTVALKDSSGTALLTATSAGDSVSRWVTATGYLPATVAKYDLHFKVASNPGAIILYGMSLYQYAT